MRVKHEYLGGRTGVLCGREREDVATVLMVRGGRRTLANLEGERCRGDKLFNTLALDGKSFRLSTKWCFDQSWNLLVYY